MSVRRQGVQRDRAPRTGGGYKARMLGFAPLGYWRLDETSGTTAFDSSGNGRNGTITGSNFLLNQPGAINNTDPGAKSVKLTGSATHILIPTGSWMNVTDHASWVWWMKSGFNANNAGIFSRYQNGGGGVASWLHWFNTASGIDFRIMIGGTAKSVSINWPQLGVWTMLSATFDGTTLRGYVNDNEVGSLAASGNIDTGTGDMSLGSYQAGTWSIQNHFLDEVAFLGSTLKGTDIVDLYNAGVGIR